MTIAVEGPSNATGHGSVRHAPHPTGGEPTLTVPAPPFHEVHVKNAQPLPHKLVRQNLPATDRMFWSGAVRMGLNHGSCTVVRTHMAPATHSP
jgi:hypothetical protein